MAFVLSASQSVSLLSLPFWIVANFSAKLLCGYIALLHVLLKLDFGTYGHQSREQVLILNGIYDFVLTTHQSSDDSHNAINSTKILRWRTIRSFWCLIMTQMPIISETVENRNLNKWN